MKRPGYHFQCFISSLDQCFNFAPWLEPTPIARCIRVCLHDTSYDSSIMQSVEINVNECRKAKHSRNSNPHLFGLWLQGPW